MKFYKRFPGDIQIKTGHLTPAEFGVYDRLLDHYYATEQPLPVHRCDSIARAMTKTDREAVQRVLAEFFEHGPDGYSQARADQEIAHAQPRIEAARENGKRGGRPKKETPREPIGFPEETQGEPNGKASQKPDISEEAKASSSSAEPTRKRPTIPCPYDAVVALYHEVLPEMPPCRTMEPPRQKALRTRWAWVLKRLMANGEPMSADGALQWFRDFFGAIRADDFLMGKTPRKPEHENWRCNFDHLMTDKVLVRTVEREAA